MTILDELASYAKERTRINKEKVSLQALRDDAEKMSTSGFVFEKALEKEGHYLSSEVPDIVFKPL